MLSAVGFLVHGPGLRSELAADDYVHRTIVAGQYPVQRGPLDAYVSAKNSAEVSQLIDAGAFPWWTSPDSVGVGIRPLGSALLALDHRLRLTAYQQHLHSYLWWIAALVAFCALARALVPSRTAALAVVLYAVSPVHVVPIAWVANRAAIVSAVFGLLAVWLHTSPHRSRACRWGVASACVAISVAVSEYGLCALGLLAAFHLLPPKASVGGASRVAGLAWVAGLFAAYGAVRLVFSAGVRGTSMYSDPMLEPLRFLGDAPTRGAALVLQLLGVFPSDLGHAALASDARVAVPVIVLVVAGAAVALRFVANPLRWLLLGTLLSLVPLLGTLPSGRLLQLPAAPACLLLAAAIAWLLRGRVVAKLGAGLLVFIHGPVALVSTYLQSRIWEFTTAGAAQTLAGLTLDSRSAAGTCYVVLNAPDVVTLYSGAANLAVRQGAWPGCWFVLAATSGPLELRRVGTDTIRLTAASGASLLDDSSVFLANPSAASLHSTQLVQTNRLAARILSPPGTRPTSVEFRARFSFAEAHFLTWKAGALVPVTLPGVGETLQLAPHPQR